MRVGVLLPVGSGDWGAVRAAAARAEDDGYDAVWVGDHLSRPPGATPLEAWTVLSAVAALTSRVELAAVTLAAGFRRPGVLARAATALQHVSAGRLRLLLGAGEDEDEHRAFGLPFGQPVERVDRLEDAVRVCRALWDAGGAPADHDGHEVRLVGAVDRPPPPAPVRLGLGGQGPRVCRLAVELTDELCTGLLPDPAPVHARLAEAERAAGRSVERSVLAPLVADPALAPQLAGHPRDLGVGPVDLARQLGRYAAQGVGTLYAVPVGRGAWSALRDRLPELQGA